MSSKIIHLSVVRTILFRSLCYSCIYWARDGSLTINKNVRCGRKGDIWHFPIPMVYMGKWHRRNVGGEESD